MNDSNMPRGRPQTPCPAHLRILGFEAFQTQPVAWDLYVKRALGPLQWHPHGSHPPTDRRRAIQPGQGATAWAQKDTEDSLSPSTLLRTHVVLISA